MSSPTGRPELPVGRYRHFKGMEYEVLGQAHHSETHEPMVVYRALYGGYGLFVRPLAMFVEEVTRDGVTQPRFAWIGPLATRLLSRDAQQAAADFLLTRARALEAALYRYDFEGGAPDAVFAALAAYQNEDSGFGRGLEPDLTTPDSSALATTTALQILRHMGAPQDHPLVRAAIEWLNRTYDAVRARWPLIPPTANNAPHAPWWTTGPDHAVWFREYAVNPRAEILGHLVHFRTLADDTIVAAVEAALIAHYALLAERPDAHLDMNETLCTLRLLDAASLPEALYTAAHEAAAHALTKTLALDAETWESYSFQPLQAAPAPHAIFAPQFAGAVARNLDFRIDDQQEDGSWAPSWNWGELNPDAWPAARRAWQGILTLEALRNLRAYGRLAL